MKKNEIYNLWAFKWSDGVIAIDSVRWTRKEVVIWAEKFLEKPWKQIKKYEHTAVKVELKEV